MLVQAELEDGPRAVVLELQDLEAQAQQVLEQVEPEVELHQAAQQVLVQVERQHEPQAVVLELQDLEAQAQQVLEQIELQVELQVEAQAQQVLVQVELQVETPPGVGTAGACTG